MLAAIGLCGLLAGHYCCSVTLTDKDDDVLAMASTHIEKNFGNSEHHKITCAKLTWGFNNLDQSSMQYDLIIASDVLYVSTLVYIFLSLSLSLSFGEVGHKNRGTLLSFRAYGASSPQGLESQYHYQSPSLSHAASLTHTFPRHIHTKVLFDSSGSSVGHSWCTSQKGQACRVQHSTVCTRSREQGQGHWHKPACCCPKAWLCWTGSAPSLSLPAERGDPVQWACSQALAKTLCLHEKATPILIFTILCLSRPTLWWWVPLLWAQQKKWGKKKKTNEVHISCSPGKFNFWKRIKPGCWT